MKITEYHPNPPPIIQHPTSTRHPPPCPHQPPVGLGDQELPDAGTQHGAAIRAATWSQAVMLPRDGPSGAPGAQVMAHFEVWTIDAWE